MGKILVSGSSAYDYIMKHEKEFKDSIDKTKLDSLSVGFLINELKKESGGTGLNIAYNLALLEENAILLTSVGRDFEFDSNVKKYICLDYIYKSSKLSSSGYIISDKNSNQITAFYPGAMDDATNLSISKINDEISYAIVSPNQKEAMIKLLKELKNKGVKTFFDPGQQLFALEKDEIKLCLELSNYLILNEYEFAEIKNKSQMEEREILQYVEKIILTIGKNGSILITKNNVENIKAIPVEKVVDPTGAGDAFRAGLIFGLNSGLTWEKSVMVGNIIGSYCVKHNGGQNHIFDKVDVVLDMKKYFQEEIIF